MAFARRQSYIAIGTPNATNLEKPVMPSSVLPVTSSNTQVRSHSLGISTGNGDFHAYGMGWPEVRHVWGGLQACLLDMPQPQCCILLDMPQPQ